MNDRNTFEAAEQLVQLQERRVEIKFPERRSYGIINFKEVTKAKGSSQ